MGEKTKKRIKVKPIKNFALMAFLSVFQLVTGFVGANCKDEFQPKVLIAILLLIVTEWAYLIFFYNAFHRRNFELEIIAFFLSGV